MLPRDATFDGAGIDFLGGEVPQRSETGSSTVCFRRPVSATVQGSGFRQVVQASIVLNSMHEDSSRS